jgi:hypothetical protein
MKFAVLWASGRGTGSGLRNVLGRFAWYPFEQRGRLLAIVGSAIRRLVPARRPSWNGYVRNVANDTIVDTNVLLLCGMRTRS